MNGRRCHPERTRSACARLSLTTMDVLPSCVQDTLLFDYPWGGALPVAPSAACFYIPSRFASVFRMACTIGVDHSVQLCVCAYCRSFSMLLCLCCDSGRVKVALNATLPSERLFSAFALCLGISVFQLVCQIVHHVLLLFFVLCFNCWRFHPLGAHIASCLRTLTWIVGVTLCRPTQTGTHCRRGCVSTASWRC